MSWFRRPFDHFLDELAPVTNSVEELQRISLETPFDAIAEIEDHLIRNELITHNYWRIANRVYARLGDENLVWPTFGTWASAQAGLYMRLGVSRTVGLATFGHGARVTDLLGRGNQLIFRDIAPPFARFLDFVDVTPDGDLRAFAASDSLEDKLSALLSLDPRPISESPDGELLMILAFEQYLRALLEVDPDAKSERIFVANACVGLQEQTRIDCMLDLLLDAEAINGPAKVLTRPLSACLRAAKRSGRALWPLLRNTLGDDAAAFQRRLANYERLVDALVLEGRVSQVLGTKIFMELELGEDHFDLSDDITGHRFAVGLDEISLGESDFRETFELVMAWDRTKDSLEGTAAIDWSSLPERMNYIIDLFRVHQSDRRLVSHPLRPGFAER